jgi:hypothetical protein
VLTPTEGGQLRPIAASLHAAPAPLSIPCDLIEEEPASRIRAALDSVQLVIAQQIGRRLGDRRQKLARSVNSPTKFLRKTTLGADQLGVALAFGKNSVNRGYRRVVSVNWWKSSKHRDPD